MDVRHNTALLEQAIALVVQRAAIPFKRAEAEAGEKLAQASARRRLATGAAIAIAAVGIGLGVFLGFWKPRVEPGQVTTSSVPSTIPTSPHTNPLRGVPYTPPVPDKPPVFDYVKFGNQETDYLGRHWQIQAGHHYNTDTDKEWTNAWCYTQQVIDGVNVKVDLVERDSPTAEPRAPIASPESLARVGLNDSSAFDLAAKCPWLDGKVYSRSEFSVPFGRSILPPPTAAPPGPSTGPAPSPSIKPPSYVAKDGFDLIGNDLRNMPLDVDTQSGCQRSCDEADECVAYVFNKAFKKCFLKSALDTLYGDEFAYTAYKSTSGAIPKISSLKFYKQSRFNGDLYKNIDNARYMDCEVECNGDQNCIAFEFDYSNKRCTMLRSIVSQNPIPTPTVSSGVKEFRTTGQKRQTENLEPHSSDQAAPNQPAKTVPKITESPPPSFNPATDPGANPNPDEIRVWADLGGRLYDVLVDTGCKLPMSLPQDLADDLVRNGSAHYTGYGAGIILADGETRNVRVISINRVVVQGHELNNVTATVMPSNSPMLLGMPILNKLGKFNVIHGQAVFS
jgi:hypothetical protein